jgi:hypothetical protein
MVWHVLRGGGATTSASAPSSLPGDGRVRDRHDPEHPADFGAYSPHKRLWVVEPRRKPPNGLLPPAMLEIRLTSSGVGNAVRLVVLRKGRFSATVLDEREFADPKRAIAHVRAEVDRYRGQGWRLLFEPPARSASTSGSGRPDMLSTTRAAEKRCGGGVE